MRKTETVAWECKHCGHRHAWKWPILDTDEGVIYMTCDNCGKEIKTRMMQIGKHHWSTSYNWFDYDGEL